MAADMAVELKEQNVACVSLWPGAVMTENIRDYLSQPQDEKVICRFYTKTYVSTTFCTLQNAQVKKNINIKKQIEGVKEFLLAQVNKYKIFKSSVYSCPLFIVFFCWTEGAKWNHKI